MKRKNLLLFILSVVFLTGCLKEDPDNAHGTPSPFVFLQGLRSLYKGADITISPDQIAGAYKIAGVVISDAASMNINKGSFVMQSNSGGVVRGITIAFGESVSVPFGIGDSVIVEIKNASLTNNKGTLQVQGLSLDKVTKVGSNIAVSPKGISLAELSTNFSTYEGTLVQVNADIKPTPIAGETYSGDKKLNDGTDTTVVLHTESTASHASRRAPASAAFTGIATYYNEKSNSKEGATKQIRLRNITDVSNASGPLYAGYPEDFETPDFSVKSSYAVANVTLKTGVWRFDQAILANTSGRDRFNPAGLQCVRMQQNLSTPAYLQMNYDLPFGASKVTLSYGAYYTDPGSTWRLEYSIDAGTTWKQTGADIKDAGTTAKVATFLMNIQEPVRFRINKLGLGTSNGTTILNGRLSIEDIAVYQN